MKIEGVGFNSALPLKISLYNTLLPKSVFLGCGTHLTIASRTIR
jgi:hypothetical protein